MRRTPCRETPFFIVGAQRSGTTMLRLMLTNHRNLAIPFESAFIPFFYQRAMQYGDLSSRNHAAALLNDIAERPHVKKGGLIPDREAVLSYPIKGYADLINAIFDVYAKSKGKRRWGDKSPGYVAYLDVLWSLFPGCRIVHLVRDGRDVAISLRSISWGARNLPMVAADWRFKTMLGRKMGAFLGEHYLEVRYEDLVLKTEETLRTICAFLREPYDENMLIYYETAETEMPKESMKWHRNSVRRPDSHMVYAWKRRMSRADRILFEQVAGFTLEVFGYEREYHPRTFANKIRGKIKKVYYSALRK
jgi:hypothetical protein